MLKRRSLGHLRVTKVATYMLGVAGSILVAGTALAATASDSGPFAAFDLGWARYPQNYYTVVSSEAVVSTSTVLTNSTLDRDRFGCGV